MIQLDHLTYNYYGHGTSIFQLAGCGGGAATTPGMSGTASSAASAVSSASSLAAMSSSALSYAGGYPYEKGGIRIHLKADTRLNLFDATPHTLFICVYSLRDPNGFNQILDEADGISKLLECSRFDPSVTNTRKIIVQPGGEASETLDRPEGAKYVARVAGYSQLRKEDSVCLYAVPIIEEKAGLFKKIQRPGPVAIDLYLGPAPSLNMNTGDWSVGVAGYWFENGAIVHPVSEVTVAGNLLDMYARLRCGSDVYAHSSLHIPSLIVDDLAIGGV